VVVLPDATDAPEGLTVARAGAIQRGEAVAL
jgi:hypothetical protein